MQKQLQDQEIMADMLASQKQTTAEFNLFAAECACPQLKRDMLNIFNEEQGLQTNVFDAMAQRGWYPTCAAEQPKIDQARSKFEGMSQQLM